VLPVLPKEEEDESNLVSSFGQLHISGERGNDVSESEEQLQTFLQSHIHSRIKKTDDDTSKAADIACRITHRTVIEFAMYPTTAVVDQNSTSRKPCEGTKFCAGLDMTLARIKDALLPPLLHPNIFPSGGPLRPPKGALLYGPAGVGKSLMAAQIANDLDQASLDPAHARVHVRQIQCANILSSTAIVGEAERLLTNIFDEAEKSQAMGYVGTLVILDDVHLICPRRGGGGSGVDQIASTLLAILDGIGSSSSSQVRKVNSSHSNRLVVLAITTDPSLLDPALRRPGRLDVEIEVAVPDDKARADILRFHLSKIMSGEQVDDTDFNALARLAKGFTGADCKLAVKEAVRLSISRLPRPDDITR
jgi:SpoVK/Ycf46/Vps4 family AAA+-type ATPase